MGARKKEIDDIKNEIDFTFAYQDKNIYPILEKFYLTASEIIESLNINFLNFFNFEGNNEENPYCLLSNIDHNGFEFNFNYDSLNNVDQNQKEVFGHNDHNTLSILKNLIAIDQGNKILTFGQNYQFALFKRIRLLYQTVKYIHIDINTFEQKNPNEAKNNNIVIKINKLWQDIDKIFNNDENEN